MLRGHLGKAYHRIADEGIASKYQESEGVHAFDLASPGLAMGAAPKLSAPAGGKKSSAWRPRAVRVTGAVFCHEGGGGGKRSALAFFFPPS